MKRAAVTACAVLLLGARGARAEDGERWDGKTIASQSGLGFLLGGGTGLVGAFAGGLVGHTVENRGDGPTWLGVRIGGALGIATGVVWGVMSADGEGTGSVTGTSVGLLGGAAAIAAGELIAKAYDARLRLFQHRVPLYTVLLLAGSVVGYHASAEPRPAAVPILGGVF